jgi:hypothetical protein
MTAIAEAAPRTRITSTTVKETIPASAHEAIPNEFYNRPFWSVVHSLSDEQWQTHIVRVYRADERWESAGSPPDNLFRADFDEDDVFKRWGGGRYTLWMYGPPKRSNLVIEPYKMEKEGAPRMGTATTANAPNGPVPGNTHDALTMQLLQEIREMRAQGPAMMQESLRTSMEIMGTAYKTAAATVAVNPGGGSSAGGGLMDELMRAAIQRMLNPPPPPDPLAAINSIGAIAGAFAGVMKTVGESFSSRPEAKTSALDMLIGRMPDLADRVVNGMHEWRLGSEAQANTARANAATATGGRVIDQAPPTPPVPTPQAAAPQPAAHQPGQPTEQQVKEGIVVDWMFDEIVKRVNAPETNGEDLFIFIDQVAPAMVDQLKGMSKESILEMFAKHPKLSQVAKDPRLPRLIDEFLVAAKLAAPPAAA